MKYSDDKITLRPLERADIADRLRWETEETEWQLWDGPWEYEGRTGGERAEKAAALERRLLARLAEEEPEDGFPMGLEICINHPAQTHIGGSPGGGADRRPLLRRGRCAPPGRHPHSRRGVDYRGPGGGRRHRYLRIPQSL